MGYVKINSRELAKATSAQWTARFEPLGIPVGPINDIAQPIAHSHVAARNMLVETLDPVLDPLKVVGRPFKMSAFPDPATRKLAPELDEDRERLVEDFHTSRRGTP